jgi:hypothetical protein
VGEGPRDGAVARFAVMGGALVFEISFEDGDTGILTESQIRNGHEAWAQARRKGVPQALASAGPGPESPSQVGEGLGSTAIS